MRLEVTGVLNAATQRLMVETERVRDAYLFVLDVSQLLLFRHSAHLLKSIMARVAPGRIGGRTDPRSGFQPSVPDGPRARHPRLAPLNPGQPTVGDRIQARRLDFGLTQHDLAESGLTAAYISRVELNQRQPSVKALRKIAPLLEVAVYCLENGREDPAEELACSCSASSRRR